MCDGFILTLSEIYITSNFFNSVLNLIKNLFDFKNLIGFETYLIWKLSDLELN